MGDLVPQKLLFQFQAIFEGFANPFRYLVIAVRVRVESNGIYKGNIKLAIGHDAFICRGVYNPADNAAPIFIVLVFDKFTF